jgi:hypothetical protein
VWKRINQVRKPSTQNDQLIFQSSSIRFITRFSAEIFKAASSKKRAAFWATLLMDILENKNFF